MTTTPRSSIQAILALALVASGLLGLVPAVSAATTAGGVGSSEHCTIYNISKIIAVINAGSDEVCIVFDEGTPANTSPIVRLRASGPDNALGVAFTQTWSIVSSQGCTTGTLTQSSGASAATSWSNANFPVTFNSGSRQCTGIAQYTLTVATVPILTWQGGWDTDVEGDSSYVFNCGPTSTTSNAADPNYSTCNNQQVAVSGSLNVDALTRLCAASTQGSACTAATLNAVLSGNVNVDALTRLCDASPWGDGCRTPYLANADPTATGSNLNQVCDFPHAVNSQGALGTSYTEIGRARVCITYPDVVPIGEKVNIGVEVAMPRTSTNAIDFSTTQFSPITGSGCTAATSAFSTQSHLEGSTENGLSGVYQTTMTGATCSGIMSVFVQRQSPNTALYRTQFPIVVKAASPETNAVTGSLNVAVTGTVTLAGGVTVSGTLDQLTRICAASTTGSACITPIILSCSTAALMADANACTTNSSLTSMTVGNSTQIVSFPGNLTVDLRSSGGLGSSTGPGFQWYAELLMWTAIFAFCWYFRSYYILAFAIGGVFHLVNPHWVFGLDKSLVLIGLGFLLEWFVSRHRASNPRNVTPT